MTIAPTPQPLAVICPNCNAKAGNPCTQPTNTGRNPVRFFHFARIEASLHPTEAADPQLEQLLEETELPVEKKNTTQPVPAVHELELQAADEWEQLDGGLEVHRPCGAVLRPGAGVRGLHEAVCPSLTRKLTREQLEELRKRPPTVTREETDARMEAFAVARYRRSTPQGQVDAMRERDEFMRRQGLRAFSVYSEGYAATGEHGGATGHGIHWGSDFNDAIARWKAEGGADAQYLSKSTDRWGRTVWSYWGCRLFDNLHDAQRSFG